MVQQEHPHVVEITPLTGDRWLFGIDPMQERSQVKKWFSDNLEGRDWIMIDEEASLLMYVICEEHDACLIKLRFPD